MGNFLLSSFSLMALIIMLTAGLFVISLKRSPEKADYKKWIIIYYSGLLLWHSMGFLSGGLHSEVRELTYRYTNTLFNMGLSIAGFSIIQIAYLFPEKAFDKERKWLLYIMAGCCLSFIGLLIWFHFIQNQQGLSSKTYGSFVNPLAGLFGLVTTIWTAIIYIRKGIYFKRRKSSNVVPVRLLAVSTLFKLVMSGLFVYPGAHHSWVMLTYTYGMWIVVQAEVLIYIIYSAFPIRFRPKLVGFLFASIMAILSVATMILVPFTTSAENPANLAQRLFDQPTLIRLMMIILGSAVFVLLLFPLILKVSLIKPLEQLMVGIRKADQGDLNVKVPNGMLDEIGIVTRNFNGMVQSLKESKDELTRYANTLESQVAERTTELRQSIKDLQTTQKQLVQSEKMASLGELTAGIAHEIQNPLNFINNFSDVNTELIEDMEQEIGKGNFQEVKTIANDIKENQQKITHHGKRADGIVKGMLQHSRNSTNQKEPTDINKLADEYLRLCYHGLRAKDKDFKATLKTDYDESIETVNIISQDIGRVLLNLYTNAFYAVNQKKKQQAKDYEPTVSVITKRINSTSGDGGIEIRVADNGNGIPQKILDKIFQPFFTTKPTGQGTGLGLSLSYDIIKAHGGELKVETKEGHGVEFIVQLPV